MDDDDSPHLSPTPPWLGVLNTDPNYGDRDDHGLLVWVKIDL
jgi:hypothetical protein